MIRFTLSALPILLALGSSISAMGQTVYTTGTSGTFGYFDLTTRNYVPVAALPAANTAQGLAYNAATDTLYMNQRTGSVPQNNFYIVNRNSAVLTTIGSINDGGFIPADLPGLTFSATGTLYTYISGNSTLTIVDPTDGSTTQLGSSGVLNNNPFIGRMAFAGNTLYASLNPSTNKGLYSFNLTTGSATFIGNGPGGVSESIYSNLATFSSGTDLYGINGTTLYGINKTNGALTNLGAITGPNLPASFNAAVVSPIPEPSTAAFVAATLGCFTLGRMRRRNTAL